MLRVSYCVAVSVLDVELLGVRTVDEKSRVTVPDFRAEEALDRKPVTPIGAEEKAADEKRRNIMAVVVMAAAKKSTFISCTSRIRILIDPDE